MSLINLQLENEQIIDEYFENLCCDNYTIPFLKGGQSNADTALNQLNIDRYSTKRNNVYPKSIPFAMLLLDAFDHKTWKAKENSHT